jgi:Protein of unknown function (DUF3618)
MASNGEPGPDSVDALRADVETTCEELGETLAALGDKVDVKAQAQQKVADTKSAVRHQGQQLVASTRSHPAVPIGVVAALAAVVVAVIAIRRRR